MRNWTELGLRQVGTMSARSRVTVVPEIFAERVAELMALADTELAVPVRGITADGQVEPGLYGPGKPVDTSGIRRAALAFADSLPAAAREKLFLPFDSPHWRTWINVHMDFFRHGVMLDGLDAGQRELGLALVREALSTRGYEQLRGVMRLNEFLAVLGGSTEEFGEWLYNLTIFGDPAVGDQVPWGFQLDGHHLAVNCVVAGDDISVAPVFMGSEPCVVTADDAARLRPGQFRTTDIGRFTGMEVFRLEEAAGEDLIGTLDAAQRQEAVAYPSLMPDTLPEHYQHW